MKKGALKWDLLEWIFDFIGMEELPCLYKAIIALSLLVATLVPFIIRSLDDRPKKSKWVTALGYVGFLASLAFLIVHLWNVMFHCQTCIEHYLVVMDAEHDIPAADVTIEISESGKAVFSSVRSDQTGGANLCLLGHLEQGEVVFYQSIFGETVIPFSVRWWKPNLPDTVWLTPISVTVPLEFVDEMTHLPITAELRVDFGSPSNGYSRLEKSTDGYWYAQLSNDSVFEVEVTSDEYEDKLEVISIFHPDKEPLAITLRRSGP